MSRLRSVLCLLATVVSVSASGACGAGADEPKSSGPDYGNRLAVIAPAVVSLKYLVAYDASNEDSMTCRGVLVDPTGLVLLSNENFGDASIKIRDIKVVLGNDPKEWPAVIVARDTNLDLAYVQILDLEAKTLPAIELEKGRDPKVGENLVGVTRNGRGFDYAPVLKRLYVTGRIESPRPFWDFTGDFGEAGLPVFDLEGLPVGVIVVQQSAEGSDEDGGSHQDLFILPLATVMKSLGQAKKRVADAIAKAKEAPKDPADAPKEPAKEGAAMADAPAGPGVPNAPDAPASPDAPKGPEPATPGPGK